MLLKDLEHLELSGDALQEGPIAREIADEILALEASGGILLENLEDWRECGLDVLSTSTINRGTTPLDLSMLLEEM